MKWKNTETIYLYDGTINGLLTIIIKLIHKKENPQGIYEEDKYQDNLLDLPVYIATNKIKASKLKDLINSFRETIYYNVVTAFLSGNDQKEIIIFQYIVNTLKYGKKIDLMQNHDCIINIRNICKKVTLEAHRLKGFLRFKTIANGLLYSIIEPDNNIIEILANHFKKRLSGEKWLIHDKNRKIIALYDGKKLYFEQIEGFIPGSSEEDIYELMWKNYFNNIAIKERKNKRCQLNFMPRRYWKNMLEVGRDYNG